jgi:site-specific DNA recombinase
MSKKSGLYLRVSSEDQAGEDRTSLDEQHRIGIEKANELGLEIIVECQDVETAGAEKKRRSRQRPGFHKLLHHAKIGEIESILVQNVDRLGRDAWSESQLEDLLLDNNKFQVYDWYGKVDRDRLIDEFAYAKKERARIRRRTMMGRIAKLKKGKLPGGQIPYGYQRNADNEPAVNPEEAKIVNKIINWFTTGVSIREMIRRLNKGTVKPRSGGKWSRSTVTKIYDLAKFYATGEYTTKLDGETYEIQFPTLIKLGLLERWRERKELTREMYYLGTQSGTGYHLLKGMVTCPCGWRWTIRTDKRWPRNDRYRCVRRDHEQEREPSCGISCTIRQLDTLVWNQLIYHMKDPDRLLDVARNEILETKQVLSNVEVRLAEINREITTHQARKEHVSRKAFRDFLEPEILRDQIDEINKDLQQLEVERSKLETSKALATGELDMLNIGVDAISKEVGDLWLLNINIENFATNDTDPLPPLVVSPLELEDWVDLSAIGLKPNDDLVQTLSDEAYIDTNSLFKHLDANDYLEECNGDIADALRKAQLEKKRGLIRKFIKKVTVISSDEGEKEAEIQFVVPLKTNLSSTTSIPRGTYPNDW